MPTECPMSNISLEIDCARAILKTYHQVHDTAQNQTRLVRPVKETDRATELENEINQLRAKYTTLQHELSDRDERLARLNRQLQENTSSMSRLQEDYQNVIDQLTQVKT